MASEGVRLQKAAGSDRLCCCVQGEKGQPGERGDKGNPGESVGHLSHFLSAAGEGWLWQQTSSYDASHKLYLVGLNCQNCWPPLAPDALLFFYTRTV